MKKYTYSIVICFIQFTICSSIFATGDVKTQEDKLEKTFIIDNQRTPDQGYQELLRKGISWQGFIGKYPEWQVAFNEENGKPHGAYGTGIATAGATVEERAMGFIVNELGVFGIPAEGLKLMGSASSRKHRHVNYYQEFKGLKVLGSRLTIKMTHDYKGNCV